MYTIKHKPLTFDEVQGQESAKKVLKAMLRNPAIAPETIMFVGEFGTGKTLLAQIFGRAINCPSANPPCNICESCLKLRLYQELDSSIVGNAKSIRELRDTWHYSIEKGYRVIVVDELQVASAVAQAAFLKVLEEPPPSTFFFLLTTDSHKILKPIISRSLEIEFNLLSDVEIMEVIKRVALEEDTAVSPSVLDVIIRRSGGHARDAVILLEKSIILGKEEFLKTVTLNDKLFKRMFGFMLNGNRKAVTGTITQLLQSPTAYLKVDLENFIMILFNAVLGEGKPIYKGLLTETKLQSVLNYYIRIKPLLSSSTSDFSTALTGFHSVLKPQTEQVTGQIDRFARK